MAKKYASLTTLQNLVDNIKTIFVKKTDLESTLLGYDTKGSSAAVQENLDAVNDTLDAHTTNTDIHVTTTNKSNWNSAHTHSTSAHARTDATKVEDSTTNGNIKINGTETNVYSHPNSGITAGTYKSVTVNAQGHITTASNPTTLAGYGITDAETKTDASKKLTEAKSYADSAAAKVKNDLLNGAGGAYDTLKELGDLIDDNADAIDALETIAAGKADKSHTHTIANVSSLQSALDGKAATSHGTHVSYSTTAPVMDGTASVGTASTVARSDHKHPTDTSRAAQTSLDSHTSNTTVHITATERTNWNAAKTHADSAHAPSNAEKNQNAFSNVKVGTTTVAADTATDTITFEGSNVTITPDATNDKITFAVANGTTSAKGIVQLTNSTSSTSTTTAATPSSVKAAYDLANTAKTTADGKANASHTHTVANITDLTATAKELNYMDGVTSNVQTQLDAKQATVTGAATTITSSNLTANRALVSNGSGKVANSSVTSTELGYLDGVTSNVQTQLNGKTQKISLGGQLQTTSYLTSVIALCKAPTTASDSLNSYSSGRITFQRTNALYAPCMVDITMAAAHGAINRVRTRFMRYGSFETFKPCTFKYNNVVYGGIEVKVQNAEAAVVVFDGSTTFGIFGLDIYNSNTKTILNEEVYNSISYDNAIIESGMIDGSGTIITTGNVGSQSVKYATSAGSASSATKATQDASGNVITSTYATKAELDTAKSTLQTSINGKANSSHTHTIANITNLQTTLDGKAASSHNHAASNITSGTLSSDRLPTVPIAKGGTGATTAASALTNLGITATASELNKLDGVTATTAELNYVDGVTSNIQTQLNGKAASSHTHNKDTINSVYDTRIAWGGESMSGSVSPVGAALSSEHSANRLAYLNPNALAFEYSDNGGSSWTAMSIANSTKIGFVTTSGTISIGNASTVTTNHRTRVTLTAQNGTTGYVYTRPRKLLLNVSSAGHGISVTIETKTGVSGASWTTVGTYPLSGWSGWNDIPLSFSNLGGGTTQTSNIWYMRLTFATTSVNSSYTTTKSTVIGMRLFGDTCWTRTSNMGETGHLYSYDTEQNATFPASISGTGTLSMNRKSGTSVGSYSIALGQDCEASGAGSFAEGGMTVASGRYSHAEGHQSKATATYAHAEGVNTTASSMYSHAEGNTTTASGMGCHAEGCETTASGINTHAEGLGTQATSNGDHAEGGYTKASGVFSHAEGYYTEAASSYQHVQGQYNVVDKNNTYLHIVGNGTSTSARANAHTIDRSGNAWFKGNIYTGGTSQSSGATMLASVSTVTTAEYTALEEAQATNANTLYMLTDAEEEEEVLITTDDIDAICGATV